MEIPKNLIRSMQRTKKSKERQHCKKDCSDCAGEKATMSTDKEVLLRELKKLKAEEFNDFKFYLQEYGCKAQAAFKKDEDVLTIPPCDLENADRRKTVELIVQTYSSQPLQVARDVFEMVGRNDLKESLEQSSSRGPMQLNAGNLQ